MRQFTDGYLVELLQECREAHQHAHELLVAVGEVASRADRERYLTALTRKRQLQGRLVAIVRELQKRGVEIPRRRGALIRKRDRREVEAVV